MTMSNLKERINNISELSGICRGEWCRPLESTIDTLNDEVRTLAKTGGAGKEEIADMSKQIRMAYKNFSPDFRI